MDPVQLKVDVDVPDLQSADKTPSDHSAIKVFSPGQTLSKASSQATSVKEHEGSLAPAKTKALARRGSAHAGGSRGTIFQDLLESSEKSSGFRGIKSERVQRLLQREVTLDMNKGSGVAEKRCVCGESLDLASCANRFGIMQPRKSSQAVAPRQALLSHSPMVLKLYFDCCNQLKVRPNSGVVRSIDQGGVDRSTCFCACKTLRLDYCGLGDDGVLAVMRFMGVCPEIERLDLTGNDLTDVGLQVIIEGMTASLSKLRSLELSQNPKMSTKSKRLLLSFLIQQKQIVHLGMEGTGLTDMERNVLYLQVIWNRRRAQNTPQISQSAASRPKRPLSAGGRSRTAPDSYSKRNSKLEMLPSKQPRSPEKLKKQHTTFVYGFSSAAFTGVEQMVERFALLRDPAPDHVVTLEPTAPGDPESLDENVWDKCRHFDVAVALHRRWVLECNISERERKEEERQEAERQLERKRKNICQRWAVLTRLAVDKKLLHAEHLYELLRILKRDMPHSREDIQFEVRKLERIISDAKIAKENARAARMTRTDHNDPNEIPADLLAKGEDRLLNLRTILFALDRRMKLLKAAAKLSKFTAMGRGQIEHHIRATLDIAIMPLSMDELHRIADELNDLLNRGQAADVDENLLLEAERRIEECIARAATKEKVMSHWSKARGKIALLGKVMAGMTIDVEERKNRIEREMQQLLEEAENWFEQMDFDDLQTLTTRIENLLDKSEMSSSSGISLVDTDLIDQSEQLLLNISRYMDSVHDEEEELNVIVDQATRLQKTVCFTNNERLQSEHCSMLENTLAEVENLLDDYGVEYGMCDPSEVQIEKDDSPASRSNRGFDALSMLQNRETLQRIISAIRRGPAYFGVTKVDMQQELPVVAVLPLQETLEELERQRDEGDELTEDADLKVLTDFAQVILRFGYASVGKAFDHMKMDAKQEKEEIGLDIFQMRLSHLGVYDVNTTTQMFQLITPFSIANFRRILASKVFTQHLLEIKEGRPRPKKVAAPSPDSSSEPSTRCSTPGMSSRPSSSHPSGRAVAGRPSGGTQRPQSSNPQRSQRILEDTETAVRPQRPGTATPGSRSGAHSWQFRGGQH